MALAAQAGFTNKMSGSVVSNGMNFEA